MLKFVDIDECDPDPCANDAVCKDGVNKFTCECRPGYSGQICLVSKCNIKVLGADPCKHAIL